MADERSTDSRKFSNAIHIFATTSNSTNTFTAITGEASARRIKRDGAVSLQKSCIRGRLAKKLKVVSGPRPFDVANLTLEPTVPGEHAEGVTGLSPGVER